MSLQGLDKWICGDGRFDTCQCVECGKQVAEGDDLCGECAARNQEVEDAVNDYRQERDL